MSDALNTTLRNRTIALAGAFQAARLVQQTAHGEYRDAAATRTSIKSIFMTSPGSVEAVYAGTTQLTIGLEVLCRQLGNDNKQRDMELTGYVITLLHLEKKLASQASLLDAISEDIGKINPPDSPDIAVPPDVITQLADIYTRTISTLSPRIMVQGDPDILNGQNSKDMVRALLFAGIRAAVLWRQCGGTRMKLMFGRKPLLQCASWLLQGAHTTDSQ